MAHYVKGNLVKDSVVWSFLKFHQEIRDVKNGVLL
jgi:hypothetical protein